MKFVYKKIIFGILFLALIFWISSYIMASARKIIDPKISELQELKKKHLAEFVTDLDFIKSNPPFPLNSRSKNAAEFLTKYIPVDVIEHGIETVHGEARIKALMADFSKPISQKVEWEALLKIKEKAKEINTDWINEIVGLDHWDLFSSPAIAEVLSRAIQRQSVGRTVAFVERPLPDFKFFRAVALLNLIKNPNSGIGVLRKMAELNFSTNSVIGSLMAISNLKEIDQIAQIVKYEGHKATDPRILKSLRATAWAWASYSEPDLFYDQFNEVKSRLWPETGLCGGVVERVLRIGGVLDFFEPNFIFEERLTNEIERTRKWQIDLLKMCRQEQLIPLLYRSNRWIDFSDLKMSLVYWLPYFRRLFGFTIYYLDSLNYLKVYSDKSK